MAIFTSTPVVALACVLRHLRQIKAGYGATTMDRDLLFFRLSIIWLAVLLCGCAYMLSNM
jgi:hypothetical protein